MLNSFNVFWKQGAAQKTVVIGAASFLILCSCCSGLAFIGANTNISQASKSQKAASTSLPNKISAPTKAATSPVFTSTEVALSPTATTIPKPQPTDTPIPNGPPYVGGPYQNFVAAYGQPIGQGIGGSNNFYADKEQSIILNVSNTNGIATHLGILGHGSWTNQQTFDYCIQFLPSDATEFNSTGEYTDYHSSVGEVVIDNTGQGTCTVFTAQS